MFRCKVKLQSIQNPLCFRRREKLVKARRVMGVQLILHDDDALGRWEVNVDQFAHALCPIGFSPTVSDLHMAPILQWRKEHERVGDSFAAILIIVPLGFAWFRRQGMARFTHQLLRALVEANQRESRIFWSFVNIQNVFHVVHKLSIRLRRNAPFFPEPGFEFVTV